MPPTYRFQLADIIREKCIAISQQFSNSPLSFSRNTERGFTRIRNSGERRETRMLEVYFILDHFHRIMPIVSGQRGTYCDSMLAKCTGVDKSRRGEPIVQRSFCGGQPRTITQSCLKKGTPGGFATPRCRGLTVDNYAISDFAACMWYRGITFMDR